MASSSSSSSSDSFSSSPSCVVLQWLSLVGIIWLQSINGTNNNFAAYSSQLKQRLSMSQFQLNNLAVASDAGKLLAWVSGMAAEHLPMWLVLLIGTVLGLVGYGFQYLFLANQLNVSLSYSQLFILCILAGNSICWINTVCYTIILRNFPATHRVVAIGLSTSYIGLSAKVYTAIVEAFMDGKPQSFLLLNSVAPLVVALISAPLVRELRTDGDDVDAQKMESGYIVLFVITFTTGIYAVAGSVGSAVSRGSQMHTIGLGALLVAPLIIPAVVVGRGGKRWWVRKQRGRIFDSAAAAAREVDVEVEVGVAPPLTVAPQQEEEGRKREKEEEVGPRVMLRTMEFWLYFFVYMLGATLGLVFLNNLGQIALSRGNSNTASFISVSSSFGFLGRLMPALYDYFFSTRSKYMIPRTLSISVLMIPMAGAFFMLINGSDLCLYVSTAIVGASTGAITSIAVSTTSDLFGTKHFSVNHNLVVVNIPLGSLLFGYMAAILYDRKAGGNPCCIGTSCYRETFIIWGFLCSLGTILSFLLYFRTRK